MKLCVLFPGIGYHCDKPLLYYSARLARQLGYEVLELKYSDFPSGAKGNDEKLRAAAEHALEQSEDQLANVGLSEYETVVFIGKSIGTSACLEYREKHCPGARCILYTPLSMTFERYSGECFAFHGTSDRWAQTDAIERLCREKNVPLYEYDNANHSLETGDALRDMEILRDVMAKTMKLLER